MQVIIRNPPNDDKTRILLTAIQFYAKKLLPVKYKKITIVVDYNFDMHDDEAETYWMDSNILPKEFEIKLSKRFKSFKRIVQTMAHEIVHVKQFAKNEIYDHLYSKKIRWNKKLYDIDKIDYWDRPWEIEAYGLELGLYLKFKEEFGLSDLDLSKNHKIAVKKIEKILNLDLTNHIKIDKTDISTLKEIL